MSAGKKGVFQEERAAYTEASGLDRVAGKVTDRPGAESPGKGRHPGPQDGDVDRRPMGLTSWAMSGHITECKPVICSFNFYHGNN